MSSPFMPDCGHMHHSTAPALPLLNSHVSLLSHCCHTVQPPCRQRAACRRPSPPACQRRRRQPPASTPAQHVPPWCPRSPLGGVTWPSTARSCGVSTSSERPNSGQHALHVCQCLEHYHLPVAHHQADSPGVSVRQQRILNSFPVYVHRLAGARVPVPPRPRTRTTAAGHRPAGPPEHRIPLGSCSTTRRAPLRRHPRRVRLASFADWDTGLGRSGNVRVILGQSGRMH